MQALLDRLADDDRIAYALLFGSRARGTPREDSDVDLAIGLQPGQRLDAGAFGALVADLEDTCGRAVDLVLLDEAPPALAWRIFAEGRLLTARDRDRFVARKARAIVEYLDFAPFEARCAAGVLRARAGG